MRISCLLFLLLLWFTQLSANPADDSTRLADMPLKELFQVGARHVMANNTDSALTYLDCITRRYGGDEVDDLEQTERNIVTRSYYLCASLTAYNRSDNQTALRYLLAGLRVCNNDMERYNLYTVRAMLTTQYALLIPTDENKRLAKMFNEECFRLGQQQPIPKTNSCVDYLNLFTFGIGTADRQQCRWATDLIKTALLDDNDIKQRFALYFSRAIDHLDHGQPQQALDDFRYVRDKLLPAFNDYNFHEILFSHMAEVFLQQGQRDSFLYYTNRCVQIGNESDNPYTLLTAYRELADYYRQQRDTAQARHYHLLQLQQRDSLFINGGFEQLFKSGVIQQLKDAGDADSQPTAPARWHYVVAAMLAVVVLGALAVAFFFYRRRQPSQSHQADSDTPADPAKYQNSLMSDEKKDTIYASIIAVMSDVETISNPDFSIVQLSERCHTNQKYVSQVINERTGQNFAGLLANYRIEEACRRMSDTEHYGHLTLESIAQSVGYRSRSGFITAFKRVKGVLPAKYNPRKSV